ncbi:MAG: cold shock domain-containing protein [Lacisediminihabitans sp.]
MTASIGRVSSWLPDDGWGVIESPETPGGCWTHFSALEMPGYHELHPDQVVDFEWEKVDQDGYAYRASWARPRIHS